MVSHLVSRQKICNDTCRIFKESHGFPHCCMPEILINEFEIDIYRCTLPKNVTTQILSMILNLNHINDEVEIITLSI